jgi:hypothetical protein
LAAALLAAATLGAGPVRDDARGPAGPWFEDVTAAAGLDAPHRPRRFDHPYGHIMEGYTALGAAAAVADFDGDGFDDVFVTDSAVEGRNRLYRNNGDLTFTDVAERAGVAAGNDAENASTDALWFDYDDDGRPDLFVVRFGRSQLFRNLGQGRFREVSAEAGLGAYANAITAVAFDADGDRDLDLLVGSYFQAVNVFRPATSRFFPESFETANNGGGVRLFRNEGRGTFTDATAAAGLTSSGWVLDVGHADADGDGDQDLYVAADFGTDRFYANHGDGTFGDRTEKAIGIDTKKGMNVDWGDFDNDGLLDVYVTNITADYMREGNFLWRNNGDLTFTDVARETGTFDTGWGWGARFLDYDNDGWLDLYVTNGWVSAGPESYVPDIFGMLLTPGVDLTDARNWPPIGTKSLSGYERKRLFRNLDGRLFREEAARHGVDSRRDGRGVAVADFDNDGRLDMLVPNANAAPFLYRNVRPAGPHWIELALEGTASNRGAVGALVRATAGGRTLTRMVDGGNSFAAQSSARLHFGLGAATRLDRLTVRWPSGRTQQFDDVAVDRIHQLREGGALAPFTARRHTP